MGLSGGGHAPHRRVEAAASSSRGHIAGRQPGAAAGGGGVGCAPRRHDRGRRGRLAGGSAWCGRTTAHGGEPWEEQGERVCVRVGRDSMDDVYLHESEILEGG